MTSLQHRYFSTMNSNQTLTLTNIEAQVRDLLGVWVKVKFEDEDIDYSFGTAVLFDNGKYSPEICRFYGSEIEEVDEQDLVNSYAIAFGSVPAKFIFSEGENTNYVCLLKTEGVIELKSDTWYKQESQRNGVRVGVFGKFDLIMVSGASSWFFKPDNNVKIQVSKKLVWGIQHDNDWEFYSSWSEDNEIDSDFNLVEGDNHYYAKQEEIWKAEIVSS